MNLCLDSPLPQKGKSQKRFSSQSTVTSTEVKAIGNLLYKEHKYRQAIQKYKEATTLDPTNPALFTNRAACLIKLSNFESAMQDCDSAHALDSTWARGYIHKAEVLLLLNQPRQAELVAAEGLKVAPNLLKELEMKRTKARILAQACGPIELSQELLSKLSVGGDFESYHRVKLSSLKARPYKEVSKRTFVALRLSSCSQVNRQLSLNMFANDDTEAQTGDPMKLQLYHFCSPRHQPVAVIDGSISITPVEEAAIRMFSQGTRLLLRDPWLKTRLDGTTGLRVDDPADIVLIEAGHPVTTVPPNVTTVPATTERMMTAVHERGQSARPVEVRPSLQMCGHCGKSAPQKKCAKCLTKYCNRKCQLDHWVDHKASCGQYKETCEQAPGTDRFSTAQFCARSCNLGPNYISTSLGTHHFEWDPNVWTISRPDISTDGLTAYCMQGESVACSIKPFTEQHTCCNVKVGQHAHASSCAGNCNPNPNFSIGIGN